MNSGSGQSPRVNLLPLTYPDAQGYDDVNPWGRETTSDLENLAQDVYHVLLEAPNSNLDDQYANGITGIGLEESLSGSTDTLDSLAKRIDTMLELDTRVDSSTTTITVDSTDETGSSFDIQIVIDVVGSVLPLSYSFTQAGGLQANQ
jgi:hypothetical protein